MKQLLNTLFVMTEDAYLALENDNVVIHQNDKTLAKVPLRSIEGIMCFSYDIEKGKMAWCHNDMVWDMPG